MRNQQYFSVRAPVYHGYADIVNFGRLNRSPRVPPTEQYITQSTTRPSRNLHNCGTAKLTPALSGANLYRGASRL